MKIDGGKNNDVCIQPVMFKAYKDVSRAGSIQSIMLPWWDIMRILAESRRHINKFALNNLKCNDPFECDNYFWFVGDSGYPLSNIGLRADMLLMCQLEYTNDPPDGFPDCLQKKALVRYDYVNGQGTV